MGSHPITVKTNGNGHFKRNGYPALAGVKPVSGPGKKRDRVAKQEALVRAATKLFASQGYEATTTREIAACAGCAEGLIHRYFKGKAGLLLGVMSFHASREVGELSDGIPEGSTLQEEIQQLMAWEVNRMWKDRDLLRVTIPHAIRDRKVGRFVSRVGPQRHAKAIFERLRRHRECKQAKQDEIEALSHAIGGLGFVFGFMRPILLGYTRKYTKKLAKNVAQIFSRALQQG